MNEDAYDKYVPDMRDGGKVVINRSVFGQKQFPENVEVYGVDAVGIASEMENPRGLNLIVLGAMIKATGMMDVNEFADTLEAYFNKKGKASDKNVQCFMMGYERAEKMQ